MSHYSRECHFPFLRIAATIPSARRPGQRRPSCGNAIYTLCARSAVQLLQVVLDHLAGGVQRQLVEELYIPGHFETRHSSATEFDDVVAAYRRSPGFHHDERLAHLTHPLVRHTDHRRLRDR